MFPSFIKKDLAMLNIVRIFPVLLLWAIVASVSFFNVEVVCAQKSALEPVTIQLRWFHQFQFAGYYAAIASDTSGLLRHLAMSRCIAKTSVRL